jgi:hypothetical protein
MNSKNSKSFVIILVSTLIFFTNSMGLVMAKFVFNSPNEGNSLPPIFYLVCGFMILISVIGMIYGISIRKKSNKL